MPRSPLRIFLLALLATYVYFFEYLPPVRWVHVPFDLDSYHHPLAEFAFQQLRHGRWPQWDPFIYSGMSFASNVQAALYYPGTWLMFLANAGRERLSYQSLLDLDLIHVPLAFTLCFVWLRGKKVRDMAAVLGAALFACSGFVMVQLQHFGQLAAIAWMPLCLIGIDEATERQSWRPLWKVAAGSALAFLAGYPPTWLVVAFTVGVYAVASPGRVRNVPGVLGALLFSLAVCGVQLLPTWEATHYREPELRYGVGIKDPLYFLSYLIPNYYDFSMKTDVMANYGKEYLYLGGAGLIGIALWWRRWREALPALVLIAACLLVVVNPYAVVWDVIKHSALLSDVIRSAYYLAGLLPAAALLVALGIDQLLRGKRGVPASVALAAMGVWSVYLLFHWASGSFGAGSRSIVDGVAGVTVAGLGLLAYRARPARWTGVALVCFVLIEYKAYGTSTRQNAQQGQGHTYSSTELGGMGRQAYAATRADADTRILLHELSPAAAILRHLEWRSPTGFDPFTTTAYLKQIERDGQWVGDRGLLLDPLNTELMELYGIRYVVTAEMGSKYAELLASPFYRQVGETDTYYKLFEYLDAKPIYRFEGDLKVERRDHDHRVLRVWSTGDGLLTFAEQTYPGWSAWIDGKSARIEPWQIAFQAVRVPAGEHVVEFRYRERLLLPGLGVTLVSLCLLAWWIVSSRNTCSKANPAVSG